MNRSKRPVVAPLLLGALATWFAPAWFSLCIFTVMGFYFLWARRRLTRTLLKADGPLREKLLNELTDNTDPVARWLLHPARKSLRRPLTRPPLSRLDRITRTIWSTKTYDQVFKPARADILAEWIEAEAAGDHRKAWWIKWWRGPSVQLTHMVCQLPWSLINGVVKMFQAIK